MITLLLSSITDYPEFYRIVGYVLSTIECIMIIIRVIYNFTPENSKFSKFLTYVFKGLSKSKKTLNNPISDELTEKEEIKEEKNDKGE